MVKVRPTNGVLVTVSNAIGDVHVVGKELLVPTETGSGTDDVCSVCAATITHIVDLDDDSRKLALIEGDDLGDPICVHLEEGDGKTLVTVADAITVMTGSVSEVLAVNAEVTIPVFPGGMVADDSADGARSPYVCGQVLFIPNAVIGLVSIGGEYLLARQFTQYGGYTVVSIPQSKKTEE